MAIGPLMTGKKERKLERFDIVLTVLLAGWVPSILMLLISYTTLKNTLESKILRDRQTFVQLIAHLVDDDLVSTASIISYYQTLPDMERLFTAPNRSNVEKALSCRSCAGSNSLRRADAKADCAGHAAAQRRGLRCFSEFAAVDA